MEQDPSVSDLQQRIEQLEARVVQLERELARCVEIRPDDKGGLWFRFEPFTPIEVPDPSPPWQGPWADGTMTVKPGDPPDSLVVEGGLARWTGAPGV